MFIITVISTICESNFKNSSLSRRLNCEQQKKLTLILEKVMFEKFTEGAIKVIMLSQEEARRMGHNFVGTEQLLLG